jgi:sugar (pentulose or hexulose) kinase
MSPCRIILCADIGTSSLKAAFLDTNGRERAFVRVPYAGKSPSGAGSGFGEAASDDWEAALFLAVETLLSQIPDAKPGAICISGNGPTLVPVTYDDKELPPLQWYHDGSGRAGSGSLFLPHAIRFREECPGEYEKTRYLFSPQEWLSYRLGAEAVTVLPSAAYEPYYWDLPQCEAAGLDRGKFPPFVNLGSPIGRLSPEAARRLSLSPGIPLIAGGPDFIMALIGVGAIEPGIVCDRAGSSEGINVCSPVPPAAGELRVLPHIRKEFWNVSALVPVSGRLFEWFRTLTGQENQSYEAILEEIIPHPGSPQERSAPLPSSSFFFPHIASPDKTGPGAFVSIPGLTSRAELGRGVVEAIGFLTRDALETLDRRGFRVQEMRISGGQGKNARWNQLKADISGVNLLVPEVKDAELAGDAILAAIALGEAADLDEAVRRMIHIEERYIPEPGAVSAYEEKFRSYRELREKIRGLF